MRVDFIFLRSVVLTIIFSLFFLTTGRAAQNGAHLLHFGPLPRLFT